MVKLTRFIVLNRPDFFLEGFFDNAFMALATVSVIIASIISAALYFTGNTAEGFFYKGYPFLCLVFFIPPIINISIWAILEFIVESLSKTAPTPLLFLIANTFLTTAIYYLIKALI